MINKINIINFLVILTVFFISANIAWLNPRPEFDVYRTIEYFPIFWQYNVDSPTELLSAAFFPEYFKENAIRISRPGYPALVNFITNIMYFFLSPFFKFNYLYYAGAGYIILKFLVYYIAITLQTSVLLKFFSLKNSIFINILIFFHYHSIFYATTFHTSELSFIIPIIFIALYFNLIKKYSILKNILYSLLVGILILCKPNYACYLSILVFSFLNKYFVESIISFFIHLIPIFLYLLYLNYIQIQFYHYGIQGAGFLGWVLDAAKLGYLNLTYEILFSFVKFTKNLIEYFHIFLFLFFIGILNLVIINKNNNKIIYFLLIFIFFTWLQIFVTNRWGGYMVADLTLPIIAISIFYLVSKIDLFHKSKILNIITFIYLIINIGSFINFPLINPYNQNFQKYDINETKNYLN